jgi:hypothetical protein
LLFGKGLHQHSIANLTAHCSAEITKIISFEIDFIENILRRKPFYVETNGALNENVTNGPASHVIILQDFKYFTHPLCNYIYIKENIYIYIAKRTGLFAESAEICRENIVA